MISVAYYFVKYLTNREYKDNKQIGSKPVEYDNLIENTEDHKLYNRPDIFLLCVPVKTYNSFC